MDQKESLLRQMGRFTTESGKTTIQTEKEPRLMRMEVNMKELGPKAQGKDLAPALTKTEASMRATGLMIRFVARC